MEKKFYVLNDGENIFMRFNTSAFGSKWCGLWNLPYKYLEYYAIKINDSWISPGNCYDFKKNGNSAEHLYKINDFEVKEKITVGDGVSVEIEVKNIGEKTIDTEVSMELGINIRKYGENLHSKHYNITSGKAEITVSNNLGKIKIGNGYFLRKQEHKTHNPGLYHGWDWEEGEQSIFVPGHLINRVKLHKNSKKTFYFHFNKPSDKKVKNTFYTKGLGILAGFPWFLQSWGRDTGIVLQNFKDVNKFKEILEILLKNEMDGRIPNAIYPEKILYNSADSNPWFIISLHRYISLSNDTEFLKKNKKKILKLMEKAMKKDLIYSYPKETWMDTLEREGYCLEIQSLWAQAFKCAYELFKEDKYKKKSESLVNSINKDFWENDFYKDKLNSHTKTANVLFPLYFGQVPEKRAEKVFKLLENEFTTPRGILTISRKDIMYHPDDYHLGRVWGVLTALMYYAELKYDRKKQALKYKKIIENNKGIRCIEGLDETYSPDSGNPMGCCNQAWSFMVIPDG